MNPVNFNIALVPLLVALFSWAGSLVLIGLFVGGKLQQLNQVKKDHTAQAERHAEEIKEIKGRQEREFRDLTRRIDTTEDSHAKLEGDVRVLSGDIRNLVGRVGDLVQEMRDKKKDA